MDGIKSEVTCTNCGKKFEYEIRDILDVQLDATVDEHVLDGTLFRATCPHCHEEMGLLYPTLYKDSNKRVMMQLVEAEEADPWEEYFKQNPEQKGLLKEDWKLRTVRDPNALAEKVVLFSEGLDDRVMELCKMIALQDLSEKMEEEIVELLYAPMDEGKHVLIIGTDEGFIGETDFDMAIYDKMVPLLNKVSDDFLKSYEIDAVWASQVLNQMFLESSQSEKPLQA